MNPDEFEGRDGLLDLDRRCRELARSGSPQDLDTLRQLLLHRASATYEKHDVPRIVAAALASTGPTGINELRLLIDAAPGHIYPASIIETLWSVSQGTLQPRSTLGIKYAAYEPPSDESRVKASSAFADFVVESENDTFKFQLLQGVIQGAELANFAAAVAAPAGTRVPPSPLGQKVMQIIRDSSIIVTQDLIDNFRMLIGASLAEADYQAFLESYPVFLDPLAAEILPRAKLGLEFVTDFVVRRHDSRYIAVEIEKPRDRIFTRGNDFTREFNHAVGQVIDFQGWISSNIAYARTRFPLIENPTGLLVIGLRSSLDSDQQAKLRRWSANSRSIEAFTFDDLAARAETLLRSLRRLPETG